MSENLTTLNSILFQHNVIEQIPFSFCLSLFREAIHIRSPAVPAWIWIYPTLQGQRWAVENRRRLSMEVSFIITYILLSSFHLAKQKLLITLFTNDWFTNREFIERVKRIRIVPKDDTVIQSSSGLFNSLWRGNHLKHKNKHLVRTKGKERSGFYGNCFRFVV